MSPEVYALEQRARRIGTTLDTLKEIEAVVTCDTSGSGFSFSSLEAQRERISQAVAIYCAMLTVDK
jgi:hypothetical protein